MIEFRNISKTFGTGTGNEIRALHPLNLEIKDKEFVVLIGSNGSGKSTVMNLLSGALRPDQGQILVDGQNITTLPEHQRCKYLSRVFQNPLSGTAPELSIEENFRLAAIRTHPKGFRIGNNDAFRKTVRERIARLNLGLESKLNQPMGSLSGGQRQALTLLMATMDDSKILLMDEPTAALDPATSKLILDIAEKMVQEMGLTAILITHQMKDVIRYGDRLIQLKEGQVIRDFPKIQKQEIQLNELLNWFGD